jgi:hypothetical protein
MSGEKNMYHIISAEFKVWRKDLILQYLHNCNQNNCNAVLDFILEGPCCHANGLYRLLDNFCEQTGYAQQRITIRTGNMLEHHDSYIIVRVPEYWYEVHRIQEWLIDNPQNLGTTPTKHFGHFIGKSNWARLWIAALLDVRYKKQTLQTFHSKLHGHYLNKEHTGITDYLGLEDAVKFHCDILPAVIDFLVSCPRLIKDDLEIIRNTKNSVIVQEDFYPIQHPANLNIIKYYQHTFVDIVNETHTVGDCFFITEKTWRAIVARRPFIIMGNADFLKNLKKLGFETFEQFWSEEYDNYGQANRIQTILPVLEYISNLTTDQMCAILKKMKPILDHNYNTFNKLTYDHIQQVFGHV